MSAAATLYLDTEFNGFGGELISLALVGDTSEFYSVLPPPAVIDPWVLENVMPRLFRDADSHEVFQKRLSVWLGQFERIHIVADWPDDIAYFCRALITGPGERIDTPPLTFEIRRDLGSEGSRMPHNALADACALHLDAQAKARGEQHGVCDHARQCPHPDICTGGCQG